jgi:hypothetical protein
MRSFTADDPFEPVEKQHAAQPGSVELSARKQRLALQLIAVVFVGIGRAQTSRKPRGNNNVA